jgi:hypothetical protein
MTTGAFSLFFDRVRPLTKDIQALLIDIDSISLLTSDFLDDAKLQELRQRSPRRGR